MKAFFSPGFIPFLNLCMSSSRYFFKPPNSDIACLLSYILHLCKEGLSLCVLIYIISLVVDRKVVGQEAERGRGDPVRDRPEAEASDGFRGRQRAAEASRLDH